MKGEKGRRAGGATLLAGSKLLSLPAPARDRHAGTCMPSLEKAANRGGGPCSLSFLRPRHSHAWPGACSAAPRSCAPASQHLDRGNTTAAALGRQPCASHCSPVHHHGASATCRHVGLLQLVPAARSTEPRTPCWRWRGTPPPASARGPSCRRRCCPCVFCGPRCLPVHGARRRMWRGRLIWVRHLPDRWDPSS
jgi:hypothetical protein